MKTGRFFQVCCILCLLFAQRGFAQWSRVNGLTNNVMYLSAAGSAIFAQTNAGFFYSTDNGVHWSQGNSGFADSLAYEFPSDSVNYLLNNISYQIPPLPGSSNIGGAAIDLSSLAVLVTSLSILYPETSLDSIYVSLDTGSTALKLSQVLSSIAMYAAGLDTSDILSNIDVAKMQLSVNGGVNWISVPAVMSSISVRTAERTQNYVFVGTNRGVFRAPIEGGNWSQVNNGLADTNIYALTVINTTLYSVTNAGVFRTTDNGATWKAANTGLTNKVVVAFAVSPAPGGGGFVNLFDLFAATFGGGVFLSTNNGSNWTAVNTGLANLYVNTLAISGTNLFAGTYGDGLWKRALSEMATGVNTAKEITPASFSLFQNYPNPFNPSTVISYQLPARAVVTLKVYDFLGREVETLMNGTQNAGYHSVTFNADKLASGVYFCQLQAGTYTGMKKLLFLK